MQTFLLSNAIRGIGQRDYTNWSAGSEYAIGDIVVYNRNKYIAMSNGKAGRVSPIHASGQKSDGGVIWLFVEALSSADIATEAVFLKLSGETAYYKKLSATMFSLGVFYKQWEADKEFAAGDIVLVDSSVFVVIVGGVSSVQPTSTTQYSFQTSDNIVWHYCGDIPKESMRFVTARSIPINADSFASRNVQWQASIISQGGTLANSTMPKGIQVFLSPNGEIHSPWVSEQTDEDLHIIGKTNGTGYELVASVSDGTVSISVKTAGTGIAATDKIVVIGDGSGASASMEVDDTGAITSINVIGGNNYTHAKAVIVQENYAIIAVERIAFAPWEVLNNGKADSIIINTRIDNVPGVIDGSFRYNKISLVSATATSKRHLTELPQHNILYEQSIDAKQRADNQEESITLEFAFGE